MLIYPTRNRKLIGVFRKFDECQTCQRNKNPLQHILGVGKTQRPKLALVLINPTYRNLSSKPTWRSYRFPFIGVRHFWKVLSKADIVSENLLREIYENIWSKEVLKKIIKELEAKGVYLTNLIKCAANNPAYPAKDLIHNQMTLFIEEMNAVRPQRIITFGLLPFEVLTGRSIRLSDYFSRLIEGERGRDEAFDPSLPLNFETKIYPCYFPAGRGNPKRATEMLRYYLKNF